jgi:hypothetical protein
VVGANKNVLISYQRPQLGQGDLDPGLRCFCSYMAPIMPMIPTTKAPGHPDNVTVTFTVRRTMSLDGQPGRPILWACYL